MQNYLRSFLTQMETRLAEGSAQAAPLSSGASAQPEPRRFAAAPSSIPGQSGSTTQTTTQTAAQVAFGSLQEVVAAVGPHLCLQGAPGMGKTTALLEFACTLARARQRSADQPLPIFVDIEMLYSHYDLRRVVHDGLWCDLRHVDLNGHSVFYLFDGLDEMRGARPNQFEMQRDHEDTGFNDPRQPFFQALNSQFEDAAFVVACQAEDLAA